MSAMSKLGTVVGLAGAAILVYVQHRSEKTGRGMGAVLSNLPQELQGTQEELKRQLSEAVEVGRQAAAEKEAEIDRQLTDGQPRVMPAVPEFEV